MGLEELLGDVGGDFMKMIATLGLVLTFVLLFWIWGSMGTLGIVLIVALLGGGTLVYFILKNQ